jgi:AcrR family transcriptional regulator
VEQCSIIRPTFYQTPFETLVGCQAVSDESLPAPPWQRVPERGRSRRKEPITRDAIVATALRLLDRDGLDELSMRKVADELGTGAASLYWHVGSKEGLLDLVFDEVIGEHHIPDPEPERWADQLKEIAHDMRRVILGHRDIVRISIGRIPMGPNAMRYSERVLAVLRAGGVPDDLVVVGHHLLFSIVNGFTLDEGGLAETMDPAQLREAGRMARDYIAALPADRFPNMVAVADQYAVVDNDRRFTLLIDLYVDGLAARVAAG